VPLKGPEMLCVTGSIDEYAVQQLTDFLKPTSLFNLQHDIQTGGQKLVCIIFFSRSGSSRFFSQDLDIDEDKEKRAEEFFCGR